MRYTNLDEMYKALSRAERVAFDLETVGLDPQFSRASIMCISLCGEPGKPYVLLWDHPENKLPKDEVKAVLDELFAQEKVWIAQNGKFDCVWLRQFGFTVPAHSHDTIIMAHLLDENQPKNVESLASRYLGVPDWSQAMAGHFNAINKALREGKSIPYPPVEDLVTYAGRDADIELQLFNKLWPKLDPSQRRLHDFLMDVSWTLEEVEALGVYMRLEDLEQLEKDMEERMERALDLIEEKTGVRVNPNSPQQVASLLFDTLKLPVVDITDTDAPSTGQHTLKVLRKKAPEVIDALLSYRKAKKYVGSYLKPWKSLLNDKSRLRSSFNITGTVTGRLSCQNQSPWRGTKSVGMSLHQVPRDGEIRSVVTAPSGRLLIVADYSQIELRVAAALANEERMIEAYHKGEDLHMLTASVVSGKPLDEVTKEDRSKAKAVNFGFLYGMGHRTFIDYAFDNYGIEFSEAEAKQVRNQYFRLYKGLLPWHRKVEDFVRRHGFIRSPLGRVRNLPDIHSPDPSLQHSAVRQAINSPVQATASDFTLMAMVLVHEYILRQGLPANVLGQVHDSVLVEADEDFAYSLAEDIKDIMENAVPLEVYHRFGYRFPLPLAAEIEICRRWGSDILKVLA
ncbi:MAG: DNA polymerase [Bacillota bacterium]